MYGAAPRSAPWIINYETDDAEIDYITKFNVFTRQTVNNNRETVQEWGSKWWSGCPAAGDTSTIEENRHYHVVWLFRNRGRILNCNRDEFVGEEAYFKSCKSVFFLCLGLSDVDEEIEDIQRWPSIASCRYPALVLKMHLDLRWQS